MTQKRKPLTQINGMFEVFLIHYICFVRIHDIARYDMRSRNKKKH